MGWEVGGGVGVFMGMSRYVGMVGISKRVRREKVDGK